MCSGDNTKTSDDILKLQNLSRNQLLSRWTELYGEAAPTGIRRELMIPFLAYRIQEKIHGGLSAGVRAQLKTVSLNLHRSPASHTRSSRPKIKTGSRLLRRWRGEIHEISVVESGFEYRGTTHRSLSEIARLITGTRWSGPAFFGLKRVATRRAEHFD
jgi:hypothetical protein